MKFKSIPASLWALLLSVTAAGCCCPGASEICFSCTGAAGDCTVFGAVCNVDLGLCTPNNCAMSIARSPADGGPKPVNCRYVSQAVTTKVLACAGVYKPGGAAALCPASYHVCTAVDRFPAGLDAGCADPGLGGIYVADISTWHDPANITQGSCQQVASWLPGLSSCGTAVGAGANATAPTCSGWGRSVICSKTSNLSCPAANVASASNTDPQSGVLCCQ